MIHPRIGGISDSPAKGDQLPRMVERIRDRPVYQVPERVFRIGAAVGKLYAPGGQIRRGQSPEKAAGFGNPLQRPGSQIGEGEFLPVSA